MRRLTEAERESRSAEAKEDGNEYGVQGDLRDLEHTLVPGWHCSSLCCGHSNPASSWIILADGCGCVYLPKAMRNGCADRYGLLLFGFLNRAQTCLVIFEAFWTAFSGVQGVSAVQGTTIVSVRASPLINGSLGLSKSA